MRRRIVALGARPEVWLVGLLAWLTLSALRSAGTPWARAALTEWLRWGAGIGLCLALGAGLTRPRTAARALTVLAGALTLACLSAGRGANGVAGPFREHQLCGSGLLVLLPYALAVALTAHRPGWRWGAQAAAAGVAVCLVLTETRSAWAGAAVAGLTFAVLWLRQRPGAVEGRLPRWAVPTMLAAATALAFVALLAATDMREPLTARAGTLSRLGHDASWRSRLAVWRGTARMIADRPGAGWGLGRYPAAQRRWTRVGGPVGPEQRPSLSEEAHDLYLQTAAETELVGLGLYALALAAFVAQGAAALRAARGGRVGSREAIIIASLALTTGQAVDALASPSWQFGEVSLLFWAGMGLGLAAIRRAAPEPARHDAVARPLPRAARVTAAGTATLAALSSVVPLGLLPPVEAYNHPVPPTFTMMELSPLAGSGSAPGTVAFTLYADYSDGSRVDVTNDVSPNNPLHFTKFISLNSTGLQPSLSAFGTTSGTRNILTLSQTEKGKTLKIQANFYDNDVAQQPVTTTFTINP